MGKLLSNRDADELPAIFEAVRNIQQSTRGRPIRRDRGGTGKGTEFGLCTITEEGENDKEYLVDVVVGNPQITVETPPEPDDVIKGVLYLNYATTNAVAVGAQIFTILYATTKELPPPVEGEEPDKLPTYDCIPMETLYNLVALPEEEEPPP